MSTTATPAPERLQKRLAELGLASRREAEGWIRAGRLTVNGVVATLGVRVGPRDEIHLDGRPVRRRAGPDGAVFIANRSPGEDLREPDETGERDSMLERLPKRAGRRFVTVSPMPRIDGGLEVVTSDGELATRLQRATRGLLSAFSVRVFGELRAEQLQGVLGGETDRGDRLDVVGCESGGGEASNRWYEFKSRGASGKDVRQLFERQGAIVSRVLRTRFGSFELERSLPRGKWRRVTSHEIDTLLGVEPAPQAAAAPEPRARRRPAPKPRPSDTQSGFTPPRRSRRAAEEADRGRSPPQGKPPARGKPPTRGQPSKRRRP